MRASGSGGNLTFTTSMVILFRQELAYLKFPPRNTNVASTADAVAASDLQIFTREGRHIAGVAFTDAQITEYMTSGMDLMTLQFIRQNI